MATREEMLSAIGAAQQQGREAARAPDAEAAEELRIILEFAEPREPDAVADQIRAALGIEVLVTRLMGEYGEPQEGEVDRLDRFLAATVPAVTAESVPGSPFELGYAMADATGALTAEPELGTGFFVVPPRGDPEVGAAEGFGCWVDQGQDPSGAQPFWALDKIRARAAWAVAPPAGGKAQGEGVSVFQPDTGVADHAELEAGMIDTTRAFDFVLGKPGAVDPMNYQGNPGHGTGTASVVASRTAGALVGSAPLATLVPVRAVKSVVVFNHGSVAAAVEYARRNKAHVVTMSLGGAWSSALRAAIRAAIEDGVIVMAAAGNCVRFVVWPARYEEVLAVAGYNISDRPWQGSCRGGAVDISAPGEFVPRANRAPQNGGSDTDVRGGQGTSFAVALTAGVAAMWLSHFGADNVKNALGQGETVQGRFGRMLRATSWRPNVFDTSDYGAGIIDSEALLNAGVGAASAIEAFDAPMAESMRSLRSLLAETVAAEGAESAVALPALALSDAELRRHAAELSHLELQKHARPQAELAGAEAVAVMAEPSPSLEAALRP